MCAVVGSRLCPDTGAKGGFGNGLAAVVNFHPKLGNGFYRWTLQSNIVSYYLI